MKSRTLVSRVACLAMFVLVVAACVVALSAALASAASFPDVPATHAYSTAINGMVERGIIGGYANGNFGPDDLVTRQQFAKMIVLTLGLPVAESDFPNPAVPFGDLGPDDPASLYPHEYVAICALHNITKGIDATHFDPTANITRQQVITMVVRAADSIAAGTLAAVPADWSGGVLSYADPTHGANIKKAEFNGLLQGIRASLSASGLAGWDPTANATRGEVAQILWNFLQKPGGTTTTTAPLTTTTLKPAPAPPQVKLPTYDVTADHEWMSGVASEFDLKLTGIGIGYDVHNGNYPGWCLEDNYQDNTSTVRLYSSYDPNMPDDIGHYRDPTIPKGTPGQLVPWDKLNYLLNHKQGGFRDVGAAIWLLIWGQTLHFPASSAAQAMVADAEAHGVGFIPQRGQILTVILYADGLGQTGTHQFQDTIIEYTIP